MKNEDEGNQELRVAYQIVQFLQTQKEKSSNLSDDVDAACRHISVIFGFDHNDPELFKRESLFPTGLKEIFTAGAESLQATSYNEKVEKASKVPNFDAFVKTVEKKGYFDGAEEGSVEYLKRHAKVVTKFQNKVDSTKSVSTSPSSKAASSSSPSAEVIAKADEKKTEGNTFLTQKKYTQAIASYSEAINLVPAGPSTHIYYCNRAAARCHVQLYRDAILDCEESIKLNSSYVKAYSRLGLAHYFLKEYYQSIAAYEQALQLEPDNKSIKDSLEQAKAAKEKESVTTTQQTPPSGMPDLSSLAGMMGGLGGGASGMPDLASMMAGLRGGGSGAGGMPDIGSLMQNPQMMQMAQQMMQNPQMMQQAMSMAQNMGLMGGAGGGPDLNALASMMGGGGGSGVPDFSGFSDDNKK